MPFGKDPLAHLGRHSYLLSVLRAILEPTANWTLIVNILKIFLFILFTTHYFYLYYTLFMCVLIRLKNVNMGSSCFLALKRIRRRKTNQSSLFFSPPPSAEATAPLKLMCVHPIYIFVFLPYVYVLASFVGFKWTQWYHILRIIFEQSTCKSILCFKIIAC